MCVLHLHVYVYFCVCMCVYECLWAGIGHECIVLGGQKRTLDSTGLEVQVTDLSEVGGGNSSAASARAVCALNHLNLNHLLTLTSSSFV